MAEQKSRYKSSEEAAGPVAPEVTMPSSGDFGFDDIPDIEVVVDVEADRADWAAKMRFAREPVQIRIHESNDPNAEPRVPVCVGGELSHPKFGNHLPRGMDIWVRRCVAEQLLRSKPITVKTTKTVDQDGNDTAKITRTVGSLYPFELVNPKPVDVAWQKRIRSEA